MGLVAAEIERRGIATSSVSMMPEITEAVRTPRALLVPFGLGCPFGEPGDRETQTGVLRSMLALCERIDVPLLQNLGGGRDVR